jgi:dTDP-4-amino-4,6-dideoxygalactose transaminase
VNLLGLGDDAERISVSIAGRGIRLVHDSAQWFPEVARPWPGDAVVLSFGRGKPLNLLGGGALIILDRDRRSVADEAPVHRTRPRAVGAMLFNALTHPCLYGTVIRLPFLGVGETRYREPVPLERLPDAAFGRLGSAVKVFGAAHAATEAWTSTVAGWAPLGITPLLPAAGKAGPRRLRLALLAHDRRHRDAVLAALNSRGLGASPMYDSALPAVKGLPAGIAEQGPFPNAESLAGRLFTLPTHALVTARTIARADSAMRGA